MPNTTPVFLTAAELSEIIFGLGVGSHLRTRLEKELAAFHSVPSDTVPDTTAERLLRARTLYVRATTRPELDAVAYAQELLSTAWDANRKLRTRALETAKAKLTVAEKMANEIFDSVLDGKVAP